jgi:multiple sugar transport system permease protein
MFYKISIARRLLLHGALIAGAALFSLPFVWMIGTSMMNEHELFRPGVHLLPRAPQARLQSPFLDDEEFPLPQKPLKMSAAVWQEQQPIVLRLVRRKLQTLKVANSDGLPADALTAEVVKGVWHRLLQAVDPDLWLDTANYPALVNGNLNQEMVDDVRDKIRRRLCLGHLGIRTSDYRQIDLAQDISPVSIWKPTTDNTRLQEITDQSQIYALVHYDLGRSDSWQLKAVLNSPVPLDTVRTFTLAMCQDETWHHFGIVIEYAGQRWVPDEPLYLGGWQWQQIILKKWDPQTYNPYESHPWVWLKQDPASSTFNEPGKLRVTLTASRSTPIEAWYGKALYNYKEAWKYVPMWRYAATSFALVAVNIVLMVLSSSLAAYAFARLQWPGRDFLFILLLGTLMIPQQVTLIPGFIIMKSLGWYNTLNPLWIGAAFGSAFNIFLLRQFMKGIPMDLEDAARIDGCGFLRIWWHIMLPLVKPTLAAIAVFTFIGTWNDFLTPLIYLNDQRLYPLSLGLFQLQTVLGTDYAMMMAGSIIMTLPVIAVFFFAQKYFVQGITLTGMKA